MLEKKMNVSVIHRLVTFSILLSLVVILSIMSPKYMTLTNILNIFRQQSVTLIVVSAATMLMISGGMDLSPGGVMGLVAVVVAKLAQSGIALGLAILLGLLVAMLAGSVSGFLVTVAKVPPMIATMGVWYITKGLAYVLSSSSPVVKGLPKNYNWVIGFVGPIPILLLIATVVFIVFYILLNYTLLGQYAFAIGGNRETARLSGIQVNKITTLYYILAALMSGFAGILQSSRISSGDPNFSTSGMEFAVIVSIIVGGTSLLGGQGSLIGSLIGVLILGNLSNGMNLLGLGNVYQIIVEGIVLIVAVVLDLTLKGNGLNFKTLRIKICKGVGRSNKT